MNHIKDVVTMLENMLRLLKPKLKQRASNDTY